MPDKKINIVGISGSLKKTSANSILLRTISGFTPTGSRFTIYDELELLPHFNPDKEHGNEIVKRFRNLLKQADGIVICTPEYAFGVPGVLKNGLDWTVSSGELNEKPVVAVSASPMYEGASKAMASLLLTLGALGTRMTETSHISIPDILNKIGSNGEITHEQTLWDLKTIFEGFVKQIEGISLAQ